MDVFFLFQNLPEQHRDFQSLEGSGASSLQPVWYIWHLQSMHALFVNIWILKDAVIRNCEFETFQFPEKKEFTVSTYIFKYPSAALHVLTLGFSWMCLHPSYLSDSFPLPPLNLLHLPPLVSLFVLCSLLPPPPPPSIIFPSRFSSFPFPLHPWYNIISSYLKFPQLIFHSTHFPSLLSSFPLFSLYSLHPAS